MERGVLLENCLWTVFSCSEAVPSSYFTQYPVFSSFRSTNDSMDAESQKAPEVSLCSPPLP